MSGQGPPRVSVRCAEAPGGYRCDVRVEGVGGGTRHEVRVSADDLARLAPGLSAPGALVAAAFEYLFEREPPGSILATFDIMVIERYFPGFTRQMRSRDWADEAS